MPSWPTFYKHPRQPVCQYMDFRYSCEPKRHNCSSNATRLSPSIIQTYIALIQTITLWQWRHYVTKPTAKKRRRDSSNTSEVHLDSSTITVCDVIWSVTDRWHTKMAAGSTLYENKKMMWGLKERHAKLQAQNMDIGQAMGNNGCATDAFTARWIGTPDGLCLTQMTPHLFER